MVRIEEIKLLRPVILLFTVLLALTVIVGFATAQNSSQAGESGEGTEVVIPCQFGAVNNNTTAINITAEVQNTQALIAIGAALAIGIAGIGAATGIGIAGASGIGAVAEKPERFGKSLVLQAMPMTQGIYGL